MITSDSFKSWGSLLGGGLGAAQAPGTDPTKVDPFGPFREQMVQELDQLLSGDTSVITKSPEYSALLAQGTQAVKRKAAATGMAGSGNEAYALTDVGSQAASQTFQDLWSLLSTFSGAASFNPEAMAGLYGKQQDLQNALPMAALNLAGSVL